MKRIFTFFVLLLVIGVVIVSANAEEFKYEDKIGVIKIKPGEPIHIAYWLWNDQSGIDAKRGVEIAFVELARRIAILEN